MLHKGIFENKNHKKIITGGVVLVALACGFFVGVFVQTEKVKDYVDSIKNIRETTENKYINPLIGSVSSPATDIGIYLGVKKRVHSYLNKELKNGELEDFSLYFKDVNTPFWFGINEQADFVPASLYKLPIAIALYKQAEMEGLSFLQSTVIYTKEIDEINKNVSGNEATRLVVGNAYRVEDLIVIMLKESDNGAKNLLISVLNNKYIIDLFTLLNISIKNEHGYVISSRNYAHFLRVLYNASYINTEHSEHVLSLLVISNFKDGLVAGVPRNIEVSHKFGTYAVTENGVSYAVLHDCGIVYHSENPYVICFMTKGKNIDYLYSIIANVSRMVYEAQNSGDR